jgi:hypothetical protein
MLDKSWAERKNTIDKCRQIAYNAKSEWFQEYWYKVADELEAKYIFSVGQPWLRTYDGKLN